MKKLKILILPLIIFLTTSLFLTVGNVKGTESSPEKYVGSSTEKKRPVRKRSRTTSYVTKIKYDSDLSDEESENDDDNKDEDYISPKKSKRNAHPGFYEYRREEVVDQARSPGINGEKGRPYCQKCGKVIELDSKGRHKVINHRGKPNEKVFYQRPPLDHFFKDAKDILKETENTNAYLCSTPKTRNKMRKDAYNDAELRFVCRDCNSKRTQKTPAHVQKKEIEQAQNNAKNSIAPRNMSNEIE